MLRIFRTWCVAIFFAMLWPAQAGAVSYPDCGGENQRTCKGSDQEYYANGFRECEYDLTGSNGVCVNELRRIWTRRSAWLEWAIYQQRYGVQGAEPVNWISNVGAHNAFSSLNQGFGYNQSNHKYSVTDLLRMGARTLEIDPHWYVGKVLLCHNGVGPQCPGYSRLLAYLLDEVRNWLDANPGEVIFLKFDEHMDSQYGDMESLVQYYLGSKVYKRASNPAAWPTLAQMKAAGTQVLIGTRGKKVTGSTWFWYFDTDYVTGEDHPDQIATSTCIDGDNRTVFRRPTQLWSAVSEGRSSSNDTARTGLIQPGAGTVAGLMRCGVSWIGLDFLDALDAPVLSDFRSTIVDSRLEESIWSFEANEYGANGPMFMRGSSGRWASGPATGVRRFACQLPAAASFNTYSRQFVVTSKADVWNRGADTCRAEFGVNATFAAPSLPYLNGLLATASAGAEVWLNYSLVTPTDPTVSPGKLAFIGASGMAPGTRELVVYGRPTQPTALIAKADQTWVVLTPLDSGASLPQGNRFLVSIDPATAPRAVGTYSATIATNYLGASGQPTNVAVSYQVIREAAVSLSFGGISPRQPASVDATVQLSSLVSGQPLTGGTVTLREVIPGSNGADTTFRTLGTAGLPGTGQSLTVPISLNSITVGAGTHTVLADYTGGVNHTTSTSAPLTLKVLPRIAVQPEVVTFNMSSGGPLPAGQALKIAGASAPVNVAKLPSWASVSGSGNDRVISLNSGALQFSAGTVEGSFIVGDGNVPDTEVPIRVQVALPAGSLPQLVASTAGARIGNNVAFRVSNAGRGAAAAVELTSVGIETLAGSGVATLPGSVPLPLGTIAAGGSADFQLPLRWPASVQRIRLTLTFTSNSGAYNATRVLNLIR